MTDLWHCGLKWKKKKRIFTPSAVNHRSGVCFSCFQPQRWRVFITWIKEKRVITVKISFKTSLSVCLRLWINCLKFWAHSCSVCVRMIINCSYSLWRFWRGLWQGIQRVPNWHINIINSHMFLHRLLLTYLICLIPFFLNWYFHGVLSIDRQCLLKTMLPSIPQIRVMMWNINSQRDSMKLMSMA